MMRRGGSVGAALVMTTVLGLVGTPSAIAQDQTYQVPSCAATASGMNDAWHGTGIGPKLAAPDRFGKRCADGFGLSASTQGSSGVAYGSYAAQSFAAPEGARIVGFRLTSVSVVLRTGAGAWRVGLTTDRGWIASCTAGQRCGLGGPSYNHEVAPAKRLSIVLQCADRGGCRTRTSKGAAAAILVRGIVVKLRDTEKPSLVQAHAATFGYQPPEPVIDPNRWYSGNLTLREFAADDGSGVNGAVVVVNGRVDTTVPLTCSDARPQPCPPSVDRRLPLKTSGPAWIDGRNDVKVVATDRVGNSVQQSYKIFADNTAPAAPSRIGATGDGRWQAKNGWFLGWDYPAQGRAAAIVHAQVYICRHDIPTACVQRGIDAYAPKVSYVTVPYVGWWTARVKIRDAAGNESDFSAPVDLRFDNTVPGLAAPARRNGWVPRSELTRYLQPVSLASGVQAPPSGIAGYSTSLNGADPDGTMDIFGTVASQQLTGLHEGFNVFKARAISASGVPSNAVGQTIVAVDATDPTIAVGGAPDPGAWSRTAVTLTFQGKDALSGMNPAPDGAPVEKGGFLTYQLDGGAPQRVPGGNSGLSVAGDGRHTVTVTATDAAGNTSVPTVIPFRIDATPPETILFADQDPNDPQQVSAVVGDRVSGVASGSIQYRREGEGPWHALATSLSGARLVAQVDDAGLPPGRYEVRAVVRDLAGNEIAGEQTQRGGYKQLDLPLRFRTRISAAAGASRCRARRPRTCVTSFARENRTVRVRYGHPLVLRAHVTAEGAALRGVRVSVLEQPAATGAAFRPVATVVTDEHGYAQWHASRGPGRTFAFVYGGDVRHLSARGSVRVITPSPVSFLLPRRAVNRRTVMFRGRLHGGHVPPTGKIVQVQTVLRGAWRTVFTPRTDRRGRWSMAYRFATITQGSAVFRFRVVVPAEPSYPFAQGISRVRTIRVRAQG